MSAARGLPIGPPAKEIPPQSLFGEGPFFRPERLSRGRKDKRSGLKRVLIAVQIGAGVVEVVHEGRR